MTRNDNEVVEIRKGDSLIRLSDDNGRLTQVLFIVSQFDLTPEEVTAARSVLGMDEENGPEATENKEASDGTLD